ncbi:hypothetical protein BH24DEI1_BH24DEI1_13470 [soil metagenome]|jgi:hypothetical protein|nr:hypothetical protein [Deinococcota bacterium]
MADTREVILDEEISAKERAQFSEAGGRGWGYAVLWRGKYWRIVERVRTPEGKRGFRVKEAG